MSMSYGIERYNLRLEFPNFSVVETKGVAKYLDGYLVDKNKSTTKASR